MARITVEDSLRVVESRFSLVHVASQRGRQLLRGDLTPLVQSNNRSIVTALREIAAAKVTMAVKDEVSEVEEVAVKEAKVKTEAPEEVKAQK